MDFKVKRSSSLSKPSSPHRCKTSGSTSKVMSKISLTLFETDKAILLLLLTEVKIAFANSTVISPGKPIDAGVSPILSTPKFNKDSASSIDWIVYI